MGFFFGLTRAKGRVTLDENPRFEFGSRAQGGTAGRAFSPNMTRQIVDTGTRWEEMAGYARAVRVGDRVLVSGTTATDSAGQLVGAQDAAAQARFIFDKIGRALSQLGATMNDVVRTRVYVRNIADWEGVARVHGEIFREVRPANTLVQALLVGEEYLVEIEAEAVVGAGVAQ